jgi:NTE family protein
MKISSGNSTTSYFSNEDSLLVNLKQILSDFFSQLPEQEVDKIISKVSLHHLESGEVLFREGEQGDILYFLISGRLQAVVGFESDNPKSVGEISRGESVGEMALLTGKPRTATVLAKRDCHLAKLHKNDFEFIISQHPEIVKDISKLIIRRMTKTMHHNDNLPKIVNIAILPANEGQDIDEFSSQLFGTIDQKDKSFVDSGIVQDQFKTGASSGEVLSWLTDLENKNDVIIYKCDNKNTEWTQQCLRQADKILVVVEPKDKTTLGTLEKSLLYDSGKFKSQIKELIILYPEDCETPTVSHKLTSIRNISRHYNIRKNDKKHISRLGRMVVNKGIGLVLSGGGARGFAHLGIVKVFKEHGIPIDMVCGTSIGSILGAAIARDWETDKLINTCRKAFIEDKPLRDYTFPVTSLIKGHQLQKIMQKYFEDIHIEDLWLNYFCISGNYSTSEQMEHHTGPAWLALTASASIPGVLAPVVQQNHLLVDGAVFNNFPADVMKAKYEGVLIGIDLKIDTEYKLNYPKIPGGWNLLLSKIIPFRKKYKVPGIASIMIKSTLLASTNHQRMMADYLDFHLKPPVGNFSLLKMEAYDDIVAVGEEYAKEFLKDNDMTRLMLDF